MGFTPVGIRFRVSALGRTRDGSGTKHKGTLFVRRLLGARLGTEHMQSRGLSFPENDGEKRMVPVWLPPEKKEIFSTIIRIPAVHVHTYCVRSGNLPSVLAHPKL